MELMKEIGVAATREHVLELHRLLIEGLDELGAQLVTPRAAERRGALLCVKSNDVTALVGALEGDGIVTSERDSNLRISPHAYNTAEDVEAVLDALRRNRTLLA
jgi:selenocysteine lyase/cysteine desulfurase